MPEKIKKRLTILTFLVGLTILLVVSCNYLHKNVNKELPERKIPIESVIPIDKAKFIYEKTQPLAFWMKNTYIPLDIVFVDENMQIVTIKKNAKPLSEKLILSNRDSMYVVEVNAGFCNKYDITIGDYLAYERISP